MPQTDLSALLSQPFVLTAWQDFLVECFAQSRLKQTPTKRAINANPFALTTCDYLGDYETTDKKLLGFYYLRVPENCQLERNKVGLRNMLRGLWQNEVDGALIVFDQPESKKWRFSYVSDTKTHGQTASKRYTYLLGHGENTRTAIARFKDLLDKNGKIALADIANAFSVEKLSKNFFDEYKEHYEKFCAYMLKKPNIRQTIFNGDDKAIRDFVKKLLGRLVFLYFLQKKGWLGVPLDKNWGEGDPDFLATIFDKCEHRDLFYSTVLVKLFFDTLNRQRENDLAALPNAGRIPYLNGGLFEEENVKYREIIFSATLFAELFAFFARYNFTIYEDDPQVQTVAVDPEMLGHIFENLLEDNKDKGAFYTPKEIVHYMCQESLLQYLKTHTDEKLHSAIERLVKHNEIDAPLKKSAAQLNDLLQRIKICDPAIGSGAFPMGMLQEILHCRQTLTGADEITAIKKEIIQNNIYGVDIEKGAVDIARLRFWLSLIIDEVTPEPLPNLDYKIVVGNSLITKLDNTALEIDWDYRQDKVNDLFMKDQRKKIGEQLQKTYAAQKKFFNATGDKQKLAREIRDLKIALLMAQLKIMAFGADKIKAAIYESKIDDLTRLQADPSQPLNFFDWRLDFPEVMNEQIAENVGFDVVIGNPPYIKEYTNKSAFDGFREKREYYQGKMDIWYGFSCYCLDLLKKETGILSFIATNNWTTNSGASIMRNKICNEAQILNLIDFGDYKIFENAAIQTMIMIFKNSKSLNEYQFDYRTLTKKFATLQDVIAILELDTSIKAKYLKPAFCRIDKQNSSFNFSNNTIELILQKIAKKQNLFLDVNEVANGIHPHYDFVNKKLAIQHNLKNGEGIFGLSSAEKESLQLSNAELALIKPYYTTEQIQRYYSDPQNSLWLIYTDSTFKNPKSMNPYPKLKAHLDRFAQVITSDNKPYGLHRARDERFFIGEKIIVQRKCVGHPSFSYCNFDSYVSATFYVIRTERINQKFLVGLLNSALIEFWLRYKGKMQGSNFQLDKEPLIELPVLNPNEQDQQPIIELVDKIIAAKKDNPQVETAVWEKQIDVLVYELYDLTPAEIAIIEGK